MLSLAGALAVSASYAASDTWSNAPVSGSWPVTNNWVTGAVPGVINLSGNNVNNDVATFNSPIYNGIGGAGTPIIPDDATIVGDRSRQLGSIIFDTANCGAYVFYSPSAPVPDSVSTIETGILNVSHNGSITMNAPVTNSETFLVPVFIRLPSQTWGIFNFVNNSTNPNAVLYVNSVTNDSANTRSTVFVLSGSNPGTNTIGALSRGTTTSTTAIQGVTKNGAGRWILAGNSDFFKGNYSTANINGGVLEVQQTNAFGAMSTVFVNSNGVLQIDGTTLAQGFSLNESGAVLMNGTGTLNSVSVSTLAGTTPTLETMNPSDIMTVGIATNDLTGGSVSSFLHVAGPGTVLLDYPNNYTGNWSVDSGTLSLSTNAVGGLGTGNALNLAAGSTLDVTALTTGGGVFTPSVAAIGGSGAGTAVGSTAATIKADPSGTINLASGSTGVNITYSPNSPTGDLTHPALYVSQGTLSMGNNAFVINNTSGTPLGAGTYQLILQASGTITTAGGYSVTSVTGAGLAPGTVGNIIVNGSEVDLVVINYTPKNLVWTGGNPNANWDIGTDSNFLNGAIHSVFSNSDYVTFNSVGSTNPTVNLIGPIAPTSVVVDSTANNYTFSGSGSVAGVAGLIKIGTGTLVLQNVNKYGGNTVVSNGVIQLGVNGALPSPLDSGSGNVILQSSGTLDMNGFTNTVNALNGSGTVDNTSAGSGALIVGANGDSGSFSGALQNTAGTLSINKEGAGMETLTGSNSYTGTTIIGAGTLTAGNLYALGGGNSPVVMNGGTLNAATGLMITNLNGTAGTIANNSSTSTNLLNIAGTSTFSGNIVDGSGGGGIAVTINSGTLSYNSANTYSGGTFVASGATLAINNAGTAGNGGIILSNSSTLAEPSKSSTAAYYGENITTVAGATATFTSGELANGISGNLYGSADSTNIFAGPISMGTGGVEQFGNFLGTIMVATNGQIRFSSTGLSINGGQSAIFDDEGLINTRNGQVGVGIYLGALEGSGVLGGGDVAGGNNNVTYLIGDAGLSTTFSGTIRNGASEPLSLVKDGTGSLTLNGGSLAIIGLDANLNLVTNYIYTNTVIYTGSTTISNGMLTLVVPSSLTNSTSVTLASTNAILNALSMGYIDSTGTNLVTNGVFEVYSGRTLAGLGTIEASNLLLDSGATLNVGLPTGNLSSSQGMELAGAVNVKLNRTILPNSGQLAAQTFKIDPTGVLNITNSGAALENGDKFQIFSQPVAGFSAVNLPLTDPTGTTNYNWLNNIAVDGSITLTNGGLPSINLLPPHLLTSVSGGVLTLSWPTNAGWILQSQTNTLAVGINTNWADVPGTANITTTNIPVNPTQPAVFYRMRKP